MQVSDMTDEGGGDKDTRNGERRVILGWRHRMGALGTWGGVIEGMKHRARDKDTRGRGLEGEETEQRVGGKKDRMREDRHMG